MRHLIDRLDQAATRAERGEPYSVTKLTAVIPLAGRNEPRCARYLHYLLAIARGDVLAGRSLSAHHELPPRETAELLDDAGNLFQRFPAGGLPQAEAVIVGAARDLHDRLEALQPGWKRVWVHATRRQMEDADLMLAEWALWWLSRRRLIGYGAYEASRFFVTSYENKRFYVPATSARRWREIHRYWAGWYAKADE